MTRYVVAKITRRYLQQYSSSPEEEFNYTSPEVIWLRKKNVPLKVYQVPRDYAVELQLVADLTDEQLTEFALRF